MVSAGLARLGRHLVTLARPGSAAAVAIGIPSFNLDSQLQRPQRFDAALTAHHHLLEQMATWTRGCSRHFSSQDTGDEKKSTSYVDEQTEKQLDDISRRTELLRRVTFSADQLYSGETDKEATVGLDNSDLSGLADILAPDFEPREAASLGPEIDAAVETVENELQRNLRSSPPPAALPENFFDEGFSLSDDDLDSLIVQRNFDGIEGLPPLDDLRRQDDDAEARAERRKMEMEKQEAVQLTRVRQVDRFGRAYATGRRKTSSARVWLAEGEGRILVNGTTHDIYFPQFTHRTHVLQPFVTTDTLGLFDIKCTVAGGGMTGQAGAVRLGISRALQLFNPALRGSLKADGLLTRDSRAVERKKPGKAKARKSFQWVKR